MNGICFIEPLFNKVVAGGKIQTRRIIPKQPDDRGFKITNVMFEDWHGREIRPKYRVGETVYLKEPYVISGKYIIYKFGSAIGQECDKAGVKWNNKLFMPESAARHFIGITAVRAERLQDISEEDCFKEGIEKVIWRGEFIKKSEHYFNGYESYNTPIEAYAELIDRINKEGIWEKNPWVWVYDFKLIR